MVGRVAIACLAILLLGASTKSRSSTPDATLEVRVLRDRYVMGDSWGRPAEWKPQGSRTVHVAVGDAWQDSALTDIGGSARFQKVPAGQARVWCSLRDDLGNPETLEAGGHIRIQPHATVVDTLWLRLVIKGIFR